MRNIAKIAVILCLTATLCVPVLADYTIEGAPSPEFGDPTSVDTVYTADGGAQPNEYLGKDAALLPPAFGAGGAYPLNAFGTGTSTPSGVIGGGNIYVPGSGTVIYTGSSGGSGTVSYPGSVGQPAVSTPTTYFTQVTSDLKYSDGSLGTLTIPSIGVSTKIYEGTTTASMAKGAAHFDETSIWDGNVCFAGHNRGTNEIFGKIHTLNVGDTVTLTTKLGTRTYAVTSVTKISETDRSGLAATGVNQITLYTCVMNERPYRWCVTAAQV